MSTAKQLLFARLERQGDWVREALCARAENPDHWFPSSGSNQHNKLTAEAKAICRQCPVRNPCLEWALKTREPHGIFGGIGEKGRARLRSEATPNLDGNGGTDRMSLYLSGMSDSAIAREEGISRDSVGKWRQRHGLKPNYRPRGRHVA